MINGDERSSSMGKYIGYIEKIHAFGRDYYNFKPVAEFDGTNIHILKEEELERIFPQRGHKSKPSHSVNEFKVDEKIIKIKTIEVQGKVKRASALVVYEFDTEKDLKDRRVDDYNRYKNYAYKAKESLQELIGKGKIHSLDGINLVLEKGDFSTLSDDLIKVKVNYVDLCKQNVFLEVFKGFLAGPFKLEETEEEAEAEGTEEETEAEGTKEEAEAEGTEEEAEAEETEEEAEETEDGYTTYKIEHNNIRPVKVYVRDSINEKEVPYCDLNVRILDLEENEVIKQDIDCINKDNTTPVVNKEKRKSILSNNDEYCTNPAIDIDSDKEPKEVIEYLIEAVKRYRPSYSSNDIINIATCLTQSFLTVFSGKPGCGKTSICNIFGRILGLNNITYINKQPNENKNASRYVVVSVEKGWTSKRDFIGYYNPLTEEFDKSNQDVFAALDQLNSEQKAGCSKLPYIILLDEANLSPMEYYWSDFMNICDDSCNECTINLGEEHALIPETLRFVATINNDHTTEALSPRLIDRAWIVTLPSGDRQSYMEKELSDDEIKLVSWKALCKTFNTVDADTVLLSEMQNIYKKYSQAFNDEEKTRLIENLTDNQKRDWEKFRDFKDVYFEIVDKLEKVNIYVSPRIDKAIEKYWFISKNNFVVIENYELSKTDEKGLEIEKIPISKIEKETIALDYAIAQRVLPKITGHGDNFKEWLLKFRDFCIDKKLVKTVEIIQDIIKRGEQEMNYYQFFC